MSCLICVEGPDATGKTTLIENLVDRKLNLLTDWQYFKQPHFEKNISEIKKAISENNPTKQAFFFMKDRKEMLPIYKNVLEDENIILDRYYHSTCVYQYACQMDKTLEEGYAAHQNIIIKPHLTLLLLSSHQTQTERLMTRKDVDNLAEFENNSDFRKKVIDKYAEMVKLPVFDDCVAVWTDNKTTEQVYEECEWHIDNLIKK